MQGSLPPATAPPSSDLPGLGQLIALNETKENQLQKMSLPGLGLATQPEAEAYPPAIHNLKEGSEWRFEVPFDSKIEVKVQKM